MALSKHDAQCLPSAHLPVQSCLEIQARLVTQWPQLGQASQWLPTLQCTTVGRHLEGVQSLGALAV